MLWEEPVRGGFAEPGLLALPGIDQLRSIFKRNGPIPPIAHLTGLRPTDFSVGGASFILPATGWLRSPMGPIPGGMLALPADGALGCAIQTGLPPATPYTTSELSMNFIRPAGVESESFVARGRLVHGGRSLALSEASVVDARGRLLAFASSRCFVFPPLESVAPPPSMEPIEPVAYDTPDPYLRPVEGNVLGREVWSERSGLDVLLGHISEELPGPPLFHLTGLRPVAAEAGRCSFVLPASGWLTSPTTMIQGGFLALLADVTLASAVQTLLPPATAYATVDVKVNFLRPAIPDGSDLVAHAKVTHRGRNLAVGRGEIVNSAGKRVCLMTGTMHILPNRSWSYERLEDAAEQPVEAEPAEQA